MSAAVRVVAFVVALIIVHSVLVSWPLSQDPTGIAALAGIVAVLFVALRGGIVCGAMAGGLWANLVGRLGRGDWDFGSSWATTITGVGGVLATILLASSTLFPKPTAPTSGAQGFHDVQNGLHPVWFVLNLLFIFLVLVAPLLYTASRGEVAVEPTESNPIPKGQTQFQFQGYTWTYLLATAVALWGATGELLTAREVIGLVPALVPQMGGADLSGLAALFAFAVAAAILLIYCYVWAIIRWTVQAQLTSVAQLHRSTVHLRSAGTRAATAAKGRLREDFHFI